MGALAAIARWLGWGPPHHAALSPAPPLSLRAYPGNLPGRPWNLGRDSGWGSSTTDREALVRDGFRKLTVAFACGTYLADAVAEAPLRVYQDIKGEAVELPEHAARAVFSAPTPHLSEAEFWQLVVLQMAFNDYAAVEKVRSRAKLPVELWPLRVDWLKAKPRDDGPPNWEYRVPGRGARLIPDRDIIIIPFRPDPHMRTGGIGPASVAQRQFRTLNNLTDFLNTFLDEGGIPPFVLEYPDLIADPAIIEQIQEDWHTKYAGKKAYGKLPVLHGGYRIQKIGSDINELAWPDLRGITELEIAQAFRVPPHLAFARLALQNGGLATTEMRDAMTLLQRYGAQPLRDRIAGAMTRGVLRDYTDDAAMACRFDTSEVLALQENVNDVQRRAREAFDASGIMLDEYRQRLGLQPLPNNQGQVFKTKFTDIYLKPNELGGFSTGQGPVEINAVARGEPAIVREQHEPAPRALSEGRTYRDAAKLSPAALAFRAAARDESQRQMAKLADILRRHIGKFWRDQGDRLAAIATRATTEPVATTIAAAAAEQRAIVDIDWAEEERLLAEVLNRFYHAAGETAFATASTRLGTEIAWDLNNPHVPRVLQRLALRVTAINDVSRETVRGVIGQALDEGVTIDELAKRIRASFSDMSGARAVTLARTESMVAYNTASTLAYAESGLVSRVELFDSSTHCASYGASDGLSCCERNGLVVALADADLHIAAEHPNGSLAIGPIVDAIDEEGV